MEVANDFEVGRMVDLNKKELMRTSRSFKRSLHAREHQVRVESLACMWNESWRNRRHR